MADSIARTLGYDSEGDLAQSRLGRLAVAYLEPDSLAAGTVFLDIAADPRGEVVALQELIIALTSGLAEVWISAAPRGSVLAQIRQSLAAMQLDSDGES